MLEEFVVNTQSKVPKYKQVVDFFISKIESDNLRRGQRIPSINEASNKILLSRNTIERAYVYMKRNGFLSVSQGKGYYVSKTKLKRKQNVCLIVDKLTSYDADLFYCIQNKLGGNANLNFIVCDQGFMDFEPNIDIHQYDYFIINSDYCKKNHIDVLIRKIPLQQLIIIDVFLNNFLNVHNGVQEINTDILPALFNEINIFRKYSQINLVLSLSNHFPGAICGALMYFFQLHGLAFAVIDRIEEENLRKGEVYFFVDDDELCKFVRLLKLKNWIFGKDCGVVSFKEDSVKEILCDGITTISTDYEQTGHLVAQMILSQKFGRIKAKFEFVERNSL